MLLTLQFCFQESRAFRRNVEREHRARLECEMRIPRRKEGRKAIELNSKQKLLLLLLLLLRVARKSNCLLEHKR